MTDYTTGIAPSHLAVERAAAHLPVYADVEFGVMQSNGDCISLGICRIATTHYCEEASARVRRRSCPRAAAEIRVNEQGHLLMFFPKSGMLPCTERAFFRQLLFPVPVAHYLSEDLQKNLPGLKQHIIPTGLYPIRRSAEGYWLAFG